jgi:hypothetical protein
MDEDGNIQSREFLAEELVDDEVEDLGGSHSGKSRLQKKVLRHRETLKSLTCVERTTKIVTTWCANTPA